jgi:hypothetical protein
LFNTLNEFCAVSRFIILWCHMEFNRKGKANKTSFSLKLRAVPTRSYALLCYTDSSLSIGIFHSLLQGNQENRAAVYDNKVIDYINFILRAGDFQGCTPDQVNK